MLRGSHAVYLVSRASWPIVNLMSFYYKIYRFAWIHYIFFLIEWNNSKRIVTNPSFFCFSFLTKRPRDTVPFRVGHFGKNVEWKTARSPNEKKPGPVQWNYLSVLHSFFWTTKNMCLLFRARLKKRSEKTEVAQPKRKHRKKKRKEGRDGAASGHEEAQPPPPGLETCSRSQSKDSRV